MPTGCAGREEPGHENRIFDRGLDDRPALLLILQAAGHALAVHDVRRAAAVPHLAAGAVWKDTPRALAEDVEVVFAPLPGLPRSSRWRSGRTG